MTHFHKFAFSKIICLIALLICISTAHALFDSNVKKAKEFMQAGMYPQAIALLEKEINDNPANAEAHFELGICYINQNAYRDADQRFSSAVRLKPDIGYQIGKEYKKAADYNLKKGMLSSVRSLCDKAIEYDPSLKNGIAQNLLKTGKQKDSDNLLSLAVIYDNSLKQNVADYYYARSQAGQGENSLLLLKKANDYSGSLYIGEIGKKALALCTNSQSIEKRQTCLNRYSEYFNEDDIFRSSVQFYTKLWGKPNKIQIDKNNWKIVHTSPEKGDKVNYLSQVAFQGRDNTENDIVKFRPAIIKPNIFSYHSKGNGSLRFGKSKSTSLIYVWIKQEN